MLTWALCGAVLALTFLGIYLLVRANRKQAYKTGGLESREKGLLEAAEKSRRAAELRARPRRSPQQLWAWLCKQAGTRPPSDPTLPRV